MHALIEDSRSAQRGPALKQGKPRRVDEAVAHALDDLLVGDLDVQDGVDGEAVVEVLGLESAR